MNFLRLYGKELDKELGSADTRLFTTAERKDAINFGALEFVRLTNCLPVEGSVTLADGVGEYDLEAVFSNLIRFNHRRDAIVKKVSGSTTTWFSGQDLPRLSKTKLDLVSPGWRTATPGAPQHYYLDEDGGKVVLGLTPAPDIAGGETWTALVPYIAKPDTMTADGDQPFTVSTFVRSSLEAYHKAIAHRAAAELESLRRNAVASIRQMELFMSYVNDYLGQMPTGRQVFLARNYFDEGPPTPKDWRT